MTQIESLAAQISSRLPDALVSVDPPDTGNGTWWLDISRGDQTLVVEWRPRRGFGISSGSAVYGEGPDELYRHTEDVLLRIIELLTRNRSPQPPSNLRLEEVRRWLGLSQRELARALEVRQGEVSKLERRADLKVSTLRQIVAALGGVLEIRARFRDRTVGLDFPAGVESRDSDQSQLLDQYLQEIASLPKLAGSQEKQLAQRIRAGDRRALKSLVEGNLRYVTGFAREYIGRGLPLLDLINEGNIGLIEAAKRYHPEKGVKFITFASWWVRQSIIQAFPDRIAQHQEEQAGQLYRLGKAISVLTFELQRNPSSAEIAEKLNIDTGEVRALMSIAEEAPDGPVPEDEQDFILGEEKGLDMEQQGESLNPQTSLDCLLRSVLDRLDPVENQVMDLRYGLGNSRPKLPDEIGKSLRLSRRRIQEIEARAFRKLEPSPLLRRGFLEALAML